jgi:hemoglobin-like flavoprotein
MGLNVAVLRSSFELVVTTCPDITHKFYEIFFARYPQVKPMFSHNAPAAQEQMLTQALAAVIDHLEDAPWLTSTLKSMGAKHVTYGVTDEMYGWVGECLLAALGAAAGPAWTPEVEGAWTEAYGAISSLMIAGAHA